MEITAMFKKTLSRTIKRKHDNKIVFVCGEYEEKAIHIKLVFKIYLLRHIWNTRHIHNQINGMTSGNVHELLGHQTSWVHNASDQPPAMCDHTGSKYLWFPSLMLHPHLKIKNAYTLCFQIIHFILSPLFLPQTAVNIALLYKLTTNWSV